ncbi:MAG: hypothetical protein KAI24_23300 [Planctomycetes bacterium]|nr:hypothetical protein [Planctomycetota bacterium]
MNSGIGSQELTRIAAAYITSITFGIAFLSAVLAGVDGLTALGRSVIAAGCGLVGANLLAPPVIDVVLSSLAKEEARRKAALKAEDDE